jgi:hypothetical protein
MLWKLDSQEEKFFLSESLEIKPTNGKFTTTELFWDKLFHGNEEEFI